MHDLIVVGVPLLAILAGILLNNSNTNANTIRIEARIDKVESRLDRMQADLSQFYQILGRHDAKIEMLEKKAT
jgi:uncharacterized protein with GYD domain